MSMMIVVILPKYTFCETKERKVV